MSIRFHHRDGTPCAQPTAEHRTRPVHIHLASGNLGTGNHLSVAWDGEQHICKASKAYDLWNHETFDRWTATLAAPQRRLIDKVLSEFSGDIKNIFDLDWTSGNVADKVKTAADKLNALMAGKYADSPIEKEVGGMLQGILANAPEKYGERYEFLGMVKAEVIDEKALRFFKLVSNTSSKESIGKYIDPERGDIWTRAVSKAVKDGRSSDEIAAGLVGDVNSKIKGNKLAYSRMVADQLMVRARSYSELRSVQDAGFSQVQVLAVLDSASCDSCRMLNGTIIDVPAAYRIATSTFDYTPAALEKSNPWIEQHGADLFVGTKKIATVTRSGKGNWNDNGEVTRHHEGPLTDLNVGMPSYHPMCRCTTVPVFSTRGVPVTDPFAKSPIMKSEADKERMGAAMQAEKARFDAWMLDVKATDANIGPALARQYIEQNSEAVPDGQPWTAGEGIGKAQEKIINRALAYFRGKKRPAVAMRCGGGIAAYDAKCASVTLPVGLTLSVAAHMYAHHAVASDEWIAGMMQHYAEKAGGRYCDPAMIKGGGVEILPVAVQKIIENPRILKECNADLYYIALALLRGVI